MRIKRLRIDTDDKQLIVNCLKEYYSFDYENQIESMIILAKEEYYFRNDSTQFNLIILKKADTFTLVDIVAGGGGSSFLNLNWGSEKSHIKRVMRILIDLSEENKLTMEELE